MSFDAALIGQSFERALGRQPQASEVHYWQDYSSSNDLDVNILIHYLMKQVRADADQCRQLVTAAYQAKLSRAPTDGEVTWWRDQIVAHGPSDTSSDSAAGRDEPFTFTKLVTHIEDSSAQQAAASHEPAPGALDAPAAAPAPHPEEHKGFKWPWQK